ncbi:MAG: SDR family NAD(P)-dependent oxidoreductase [Actinomycetota bacterium]|nr:SDR family oxidoreductase [Actinomycetota bacterium]
MELKGKGVLITGASRGLGVEMARQFGKQGARLAIAARSKGELEQVASALQAEGISTTAIPTDVGDRSSLEALVAQATLNLGGIDVLVNNAGVEQVYDFEEMNLDLIEQIIQVNVTGLIALTRLVSPAMIDRRSGHIVNISSMAGLLPVPHNSVYSASKHAVVGFSRSLRLELAEHGVGVSVVCPGFVEGGMFERWGRPAPSAAGAVSVDAVAKATVGAVINNSAEVKVNSALGKLGPVIHALSPSVSGGLIHRTGVAKFLKSQAELNKRQESTITLDAPVETPVATD